MYTNIYERKQHSYNITYCSTTKIGWKSHWMEMHRMEIDKNPLYCSKRSIIGTFTLIVIRYFILLHDILMFSSIELHVQKFK